MKCGRLHISGSYFCAHEAGHTCEHDSHPGTSSGLAWYEDRCAPVAADAPAVGAPVPESLAGARVERSGIAEEHKAMFQVLGQYAQPGEQMLDTFQRLLDERGVARQELASLTEGKLRIGDVLALRSRVDELEGDLCFWKREAIRLGAKARGAR